MKNSRLIDVFFSFSNKERKEFGLFVRSPYFNRREEVIRLFDFLLENKDFPEDALSKERAWKYTFPGEMYDDGQMRYTMSFLLKSMKQFLVQKELSEDPGYEQIMLCRSLRKRGVHKLFEKEAKLAVDMQRKSPYRNASYHLNNYQLNVERVEAYPVQRDRTKDPLLQSSIDELTRFYISDMLRQSCGVLSVQAVMQKDYNLRLLDEILTHIEEKDYQSHPAISIYYHTYRALSDLDDEVHFNLLKELIDRHWPEFPEAEARAIYLLAINCCIRRANKGDRRYLRECFELYRSGLENKVLLEKGLVSKFTYTNASRIGLALKEFDWVEDFLNAYKSYLPASERENTFNYVLALLYFQKPDYENAMDLLQKVSFKDVFNNLDARRMLLRIYYELGYHEALHSLLDSFKIYLSRQKNIGYHKDNYANLIYFVKKILRADLGDRSKKSSLINEINATPALAEKSWLLDQLNV